MTVDEKAFYEDERLEQIERRLYDLLALAANASRNECTSEERQLLQRQFDAVRNQIDVLAEN